MAFGPFELLALALALLAWCLVAVFGTVRRSRVERFALRQALTITPQNGNQVIGYLATTRRWRGAFLLLAVVGSTTFFFTANSEINISATVGFAGWFVGAVVAEWRVDVAERGAGSVALLHRRRIEDYVRKPVLAAAAVVCALALGLGVLDVVRAVVRSAGTGRALAPTVALVVAMTAIALVTRQVLRRPQPLTDPVSLDTDNAMRARSLNVLVGTAVAIGGYFVAVGLDALAPQLDTAVVTVGNVCGYVLLPMVGVVVACAPRMRPVRPVAPLLHA